MRLEDYTLDADYQAQKAALFVPQTINAYKAAGDANSAAAAAYAAAAIANARQGAQGAQGARGSNGADGTNGTNGIDAGGATTVIINGVVTTNTACSAPTQPAVTAACPSGQTGTGATTVYTWNNDGVCSLATGLYSGYSFSPYVSTPSTCGIAKIPPLAPLPLTACALSTIVSGSYAITCDSSSGNDVTLNISYNQSPAVFAAIDSWTNRQVTFTKGVPSTQSTASLIMIPSYCGTMGCSSAKATVNPTLNYDGGSTFTIAVADISYLLKYVPAASVSNCGVDGYGMEVCYGGPVPAYNYEYFGGYAGSSGYTKDQLLQLFAGSNFFVDLTSTFMYDTGGHNSSTQPGERYMVTKTTEQTMSIDNFK